ncbi:3,4-dehydroadipyl-CoA semialdehyde dehydrogenase [Phenylobacterium sp.]|jgi:3,4-dehydroadipyl-CoA semialdehyde dehydrogenase|uniref:3,4-dehydroadipyl-CoA semialdehyde dehydrogenase n=1 Tax=Phenylobacterium sp. TaxID=1871053 RepID=UPI003783CD3F
MTTQPLEPRALQSFLSGSWLSGQDQGEPLADPVTGETLAYASSTGFDVAGALAYARKVGGPALRSLTFAQRAALLGAAADALQARRDDWYEISRRNSGNTKGDAAIDVDGAIGTLKYYAKLGATLGEATLLSDGGIERLGRDANFQGRHIGAPIRGVAVHINAFNFPAWGLWGKAAVALLAGVPVLAKPATSTAWLAEEMVRAVVEAGVLPSGALSLLCGSPAGLLEAMRSGDAVAFTGSAATGDKVRAAVAGKGVRVNIEADSLNSALLAPDASAGSPALELLAAEVAKEMTVKAGQKCTAIRRVIVPAAAADAVAQAILARLAEVKVGDPADPETGMGPVVSPSQLAAVREGLAALAGAADVLTPQTTVPEGAFVAPTLLRAKSGADLVHDLEVFGPVATLVPYETAEQAFELARRGGGSLAASVFSDDPAFLGQAAGELADSHGRLLLVDPAIGQSHSGHGIVLPSCLHGGPGRAGDGAELGGLRGLWFYHQKTAVQASGAVLEALAPRLAGGSA